MADQRMEPLSVDLAPDLLEAHPELAVLALELPDSDGEPVENERERLQINLLLDALEQYWRDRNDFYAAGNMFLYYSTEQARQVLTEEAEPARPRRAFRGPDLFIVLQVDGSYRRQKWVVWDEEGRYPDVVFEFLSPSTRRNDQTTKKALYEHTFNTREYYWYDPFDPRVFQGWQLHPDHGYQAMTPDARGWLWSPVLQLWIGRWDGVYARDHTTWVRWYDPSGRLVPTAEELATGAEQRAEVAEQRAGVAEQRAEVAEQHAEAERTRAEAAEAELLRLRATLAQLHGEGSETSR